MPPKRVALLADLAPADLLSLAWALTNLCRTHWNSDPPQAVSAAELLGDIAAQWNQPELTALAAWTQGIAELTQGQMEAALISLEQAAAQFQALNQAETAATTQISRMLALSLLGRYDEAITTGLTVRDTFLTAGNQAAAGRIEVNLGNIYDRRDQYVEAAQFFRSARARFLQVDDQYELLQADNGLANVLSQQRQIQAAATLYEQVLTRAEQLQATRTQAMVEGNLGNLALDQGQYTRALRYLEQSRRRYAQLNLPHEEALAERELADAYLELNLIPEAIAIYTHLAPIFAALKMPFEQAWTLAQHGRATLLAGQFETARPLLATARAMFEAEHNPICTALTFMLEAQRLHGQANYIAAATSATAAAKVLIEGGPLSWLTFAQWLAGDAARLTGDVSNAQATLTATHALAQQHALPQIAYRCATSLGLLAISQHDRVAARASFSQAIILIETLRAPLPADDFRTAFFADKLTPYTELARLCLDDDTPTQTVTALRYIEQARARALSDLLNDTPALAETISDPITRDLQTQLEAQRAELNWIYSQITRTCSEDDTERVVQLNTLQAQARSCEEAILTLTRQIRQYAGQQSDTQDARAVSMMLPDIDACQRNLDSATTLISYITIGDELVAFVITNETVQVVRQPGQMPVVQAAIEQVRFQIDTFRHGAGRLHGHLAQLTRRAQHYLAQLYDGLIRPLKSLVYTKRLVFIPHGVMHYIPFAALYDGTHYLVEHHEISLTPGVGVLQNRQVQPQALDHRTLLVGVSDKQVPQIPVEIQQLRSVVPSPTVLLEEQATVEQVRLHIRSADIVHLACHGQFRPDNPLFSSLQLADGWLTVQDMYDLRLRCHLVTLSACETGVNAIAPGDELLGLVRGFLSAGAENLLVSLWAVDDASTAQLMRTFYQHLSNGVEVSTALQAAQQALLIEQPHPFFWSPFVLMGPYTK